jgi:CopG family nickel-responsive transcriptional regulator
MYIGADVCTYPHLAGMAQAAQKMGKSGNCVAALVYVYDHTARDSAVRPATVVLFSLPSTCHDLSLACAVCRCPM